ncbi:uncharacterized protein K452DRAFT_237455 [Aplosporella prunicola CBS 121167]|uniref:BTB domain-containing protein n=1 Tax=Aplosporella prunicola CBS 121167 TaxID=1176127 RepID=A0A6A6B0A9_9PEZI|nr:uncharacterized protein K452DRAFT_237455 [Aplosporella prunicola CBS 121167]KAF2136467.1 hypothetical protein K452DRAFT_237455 [Aplosporella prunicola CBS 121167]
MDGDASNFHHLLSNLNLDAPALHEQSSSTAHAPALSPRASLPIYAPSAATALNSLFSSGPAVDSPPPRAQRPRPRATRSITSALTITPASHRADPSPASSRRPPISRAEKDVDDPTTPVESSRSADRREFQNLTTLNKLFAGPSPNTSRMSSYNQIRPLAQPAMALGSVGVHLYQRGLLDGRHSDITVCAFGKSYKLHRLVLDQAPFFSSALSGPWLESHSKEITLHPEEIDACITQNAFELTLKRLYGCDISDEEDAECLGLFATACWLDMQDLVDSSIDSIMRRMHPDNLGPLIKLVTIQYYGRAGQRVLASAKAMLCRDGCEMTLRNWDEIPGEIVREIVGGDGFYVHGEWERWALAKCLLDRRLKKVAVELGIIKSTKVRGVKAPDTLALMAVRFDSVYRQNAITTGLSRQSQNEQECWISLYTHHEIEPLLVLLEEGIHYIHLDFEELQYIRQARDVFNLPIVSERTTTNALWMQMELRQKVTAADPQDMELGLSQTAEPEQPHRIEASAATSGKGKAPASNGNAIESDDEEMDSGSWDANGKPRKFWIPSTDCNIVMGGAAEPVVTTTSSSPRHASRLSATLQPADAQWATDFTISPDADRIPTPLRPGSAGRDNTSPFRGKGVSYTNFPPFRFAAEFPNPRLLKEKKRVYSRTVFYAGSLWNIYIQKVRSAKNPQLGVYLHRAKEYATDDSIGTNSTGFSAASVDERIGQLERDMLLRSGSQIHRRRGSRSRRAQQIATAMIGVGPEDDNASSSGDPDISVMSDNFAPQPRRREEPVFTTNMPDWMRPQFSDSSDDESDGGSSDEAAPMLRGNNAASDSTSNLNDMSSSKYSESGTTKTERPTIPPYIDGRPTIKTYFKIYSPSKGGRLLSVYESAPDKFNFSQSWGWKSSTLMLDDATAGTAAGAAGGAATSAGGDVDGMPPSGEGDGGDNDGGNRAGAAAWKERGSRKKGDGLLRFMVVIGNL